VNRNPKDIDMKSTIFRGLTMLALSAVLVAVVVATANAAPVQRLSADFQNRNTLGGPDEVFSITTPGTGGSHVYSKALSIPFSTVYITFSAQADVHFGAALMMQGSVTDAAGNTTVCNPMAGGGLGTAGPDGWMTLLKLPTNPTVDGGGTANNCNDGGGGSADCHDNNIMFSCCVNVRPDTSSPPTAHTVDLRLATSIAGDPAIYERATIYVDASPNPGGALCAGVGTPADYTP
jgi:hypothetical protein